MEVRIGITQSARELSFDTDATADEIRALIEAQEAHDGALVRLSDTKGRQFLVNREAIAYVELGGDASRRVGFVS